MSESIPRAERATVVAIATAGKNVEVLQEVIAALASEPDFSIAITTSLDAAGAAQLAQDVSRRLDREVAIRASGEGLLGDAIVVASSDQVVALTETGAALVQANTDGALGPVDRFLRSVSEHFGERAIAVVLPDLDGDGGLGLQVVQNSGGVAIAVRASDDGASLDPTVSRTADFALTPSQLRTSAAQIALSVRGSTRRAETTAFTEILMRVRAVTGHDFSHYKKGTLLRWIERRRRALGLNSDLAYARAVHEDPDEAQLLFQDLVVGVTSFFRTPEAFRALEELAIPEIVRTWRGSENPLRAWVAGCSTGEAAYSLAIVLVEALERAGEASRVQVFATDIDVGALEVARRGLYPASIAEDVSAERLRRFFIRDGEFYRVSDSLRDKVIFSEHNLVRDPPFSRLDLLSCRNLLIYLEAQLQRRLFPLFHYSLRPRGYLLLGASESVGEFSDLFAPVDKKTKLFQREGIHTRDLHFPSAMPSLPITRLPRATTFVEPSPSLAQRATALLLARHTPACAVISERGDILHVHGHTGPFIELPEGKPAINLFQMLGGSLRAEVRTAVHQVVRERSPAHLRDLRTPSMAPDQMLEITVELLDPDAPSSEILVVFKTYKREGDGPLVSLRENEDGSRRERDLEKEVRSLREALQTTIEDLESANEGLTSSNEELLSMNEELQSANEELETSKEEVQSVNEELATVNAELNDNVAQLTRTNNDVTNLLASTSVATLFLDRDLKIARFTPAISSLYKVQASDIGRPIDDLTSTLDYPQLRQDAQAVVDSLQTVERQVRSRDEGYYLVRLMPYRTLDQRIEGVVATFVDITHLETARQELADALATVTHYKEALDASTQVVVLDSQGVVIDANRRFFELVGHTHGVVGGMRLLDPKRLDPKTLGEVWATLQRIEVWRGVLPVPTQAREERTVEATVVPLGDSAKAPARYLALMHDITEKIAADRAMRASEARFRAVFERAAIGIALLDENERVVAANPALARMLGHAQNDLLGAPLSRHVYADDRSLHQEPHRETIEGVRTSYEIERRYVTRSGERVTLHETVSAIVELGPAYLIAMLQDVTGQRRSADLLRSQTSLAHLGEMAAVIAHEVRNALAGIRAAVEVIGMRLPEGSEERQAVTEVRARVSGLDETVHSLLGFARPRPPDLKPVSFHRLAATLTGALSAGEVVVDLQTRGPDLKLLGDEQLLTSALMNLCMNAGQASEAASAVLLTAERDDESAVLRVIDQGRGIPAELAKRVLEPFYTTRSRGTGLGLPIAKRIVEAPGGTLSIDSTAEIGTTVIVRLPLAPEVSA